MKKTNYLMEEVHVSGTQTFYLKEGRVFGNVSAFKVGASKTTNRSTGEVVENKEQFRIQMKVRGTTDFSILSSVTLDQLKVATGKVWQPADLPILAGATVLYYVSDRVEGKEFYYRPDSIKPAVAPRSGEFTSLFGIEVAPQYTEAFNAMPLAVGELTNEDSFVGEAPKDDSVPPKDAKK